MVIGDAFAWGHLPKTGGEATTARFHLFPELVRFADPSDTNDKHHPFHCRPDQTVGKRLLLNIRRLPAWNVSHAMHEARSELFPDYRPLPVPGADELAERTVADRVIAEFTDQGRLTIDRWLRTEQLEQDFLSVMADLTETTWTRQAQVRAVGRVNAHQYNRDVFYWFTPRQIARMYERNPVWAAVERRVYGATLAENLSRGELLRAS